MRKSPAATRYLEVDLAGVRLSLQGRSVLRGIDWHIEPGQRWVLMGPNGAGKTQLLKLIAADVWPTPSRTATRRYIWQGERFEDPYGIKQEIAYLGPERQDRYEHYGWNHRVDVIVGTGVHRSDIPLDPLTAQDRRTIGTLLRQLDMEALARRRFLTLSYGERRLVLLARALAWRPRLLLLDELFNGLDAANRARAQRCLQALGRSRLPWILSCHRAADIPASATHLCELERGRIVRRAALTPRVRRQLTAAPAGRLPTATAGRRQPEQKEVASPLVVLRKASVWLEGRPVLRNVSLSVCRGDCWVVHGHNGSGKSTLLRTLYGDIGVARGGQLWRHGIEPGVPLSEFQRRVGLIAPELQAAHPHFLHVEEVVASGLHASVGLNETPDREERRQALRALRQFGAATLARRNLRALSYGQLRRVLFARAFVHRPEVLLLDEPYSGLDARTRVALQARVEQALLQGLSAVIAVHHREEWPAQTTHELELSGGRVVYCGPPRHPPRH